MKQAQDNLRDGEPKKKEEKLKSLNQKGLKQSKKRVDYA